MEWGGWVVVAVLGHTFDVEGHHVVKTMSAGGLARACELMFWIYDRKRAEGVCGETAEKRIRPKSTF